MSDIKSNTIAPNGAATATVVPLPTVEGNNNATKIPQKLHTEVSSQEQSSAVTATAEPPTTNSGATTPASSVTGIPVSKLKAPTNFGGSTNTISKIGRLCSHAAPKAGPPPRDTNSMSRESDDNLSSINSTYTDMYQETVKRFARSSLSPEMDHNSLSRTSIKSTSPSQKSDGGERHDSFDLYLEATGRRRSSDHGAVLTVDTEQFIIGQRVWVGGIRPGQIAYIGETHFAPGEWAGIVLDEPNGKNDGCVAGKRYFQCEPKRGIFSRLTRLTMVPLAGAHIPTSPLSKYSPDRSRTVSPTASVRSSFLRSPGGGKNGLTVGDRVIVSSGFGSRPGILRYLGETQFASGNWCGIELDDATGKNDGSVDGFKYFDCKPKYGIFVPIAKVSLSPSSKKTRLSRTGSRESLTSIGTMNSIATTNTSRMRINAQRKPSLIKPISTPKSQFSMQDLLREKQNHIEQLMIERDLDREDAQNQALQFQKNISELQSRITQLEHKLEDERKKSEDLQFSIDEATFCGDELNAQTQVYKEKIHELEHKITELSSDGSSTKSAVSSPQDNANAATEAANAQVAELMEKLQEQAKFYQKRIADIQDEEKRLQENIKYLQTENESLQKELLDKDQSLEKFSLSESGLENLRRELILIKQENEKERQQKNSEFSQKLQEKIGEITRLNEELLTLKSSLEIAESSRSNVEDECEILRTECKTQNEQLQTVNEQIAKLTAELSVQKAETATLDELLKTQQLKGSIEGKSALEEKLAEISKLKDEIGTLQNLKSSLEINLKAAGEEIAKLSEMQKKIEAQLNEVTSADQAKADAVKQLESVVDAMKKEISETNAKNQQLNEELMQLKEANTSAASDTESLRKELCEKEKLRNESIEELNKTKELIAMLQTELAKSQKESQESLAIKAKQVEDLSNEIKKLQDRIKSLEGESSTTVQQMSSHIQELEELVKKLQATLSERDAQLNDERQERAKREIALSEKLNELKTTTTTLESNNSLLEKLQKEHDILVAKCKELEELLKRSEEKCTQQQLELGDVTRKWETLNAKCEDLTTQNATLQQDILSARTSSSEVQVEVRRLNEEIASKQKAASEFQTKSSDERIKLENQIEELNQKLSNATKDYEELKESMHKTKDELIAKNAQIISMEEKVVKQELAFSDAQRQQENLQTKYDALAKQNESLQTDLTTLRTSSTDSNAELIKLSQDVAAKQKAYEELLDKTGEERSALEGQLQASQQHVSALCAQVETLTQELKATTEESFKRFEQLKQEQEKCGKKELDLGDLQRKFETLTAKCIDLENQNKASENELTTLRAASTGSNSDILKLTEELSGKQKALQEMTDRANADRLKLESQLLELTQRLQTNQSETESLQQELKSASESNSLQAVELENLKIEYKSVAAKMTEERQTLQETFEAQLKNAEKTKITLDEAISSLQNQIKLLQDELLKSQLDFKAKEEDLCKQVEMFVAEKEQLGKTLQQVQTSGNTTLHTAQQEKAELLRNVEQLTQELRQKEQSLQSAYSEAEQFKLAQSNTYAELSKHEAEIKGLHNSLELSRADVEHKAKLAEEDKKKIEELKTMLEALQTSNANISATNAQLSDALHALEQEKLETAHIFELFEMESDQNTSQLLEKLSNMKQQLAEAETQLTAKDQAFAETQKSLENATAEMEIMQSALDRAQTNVLENNTKLTELNAANEELKKSLAERCEAQKRIDQLKHEKEKSLESYRALEIECTSLQRKLELMDLEKTREIVSLQGRINDLQSIGKLKQNGAITGGGDGVTTAEVNEGEGSSAHINFLNSIIADMQKKNDALKARVEKLEKAPTDFTKPEAFELFTKRKPAQRLFCDICDEFDKHETEDCPQQASSDREYSPPLNAVDPAHKKERKLPEPRKYCETCEVFGHVTGECDDECF